MMKDGVASEKLFEFYYPNTQDRIYMQQVMERTLLLCHFGKDKYLIPSLALDEDLDFELQEKKGPRCWFEFDFLQDGLFQRLVCVCISDPNVSSQNSRKIEIRKHAAIFSYKDTEILFRWKGNRIYIHFGDDKHFENIQGILNALMVLIQDQFIGDVARPSLFFMPFGENVDDEYGVEINKLKSLFEEKKDYVWIGSHKLPMTMFEPFLDQMPKLQDGDMTKSTLSSQEETNVATFDAFLAHAWGKDGKNHERVNRIAAALEKQGLKVWIDSKFAEGDLDLALLNGINASKVFVCFITREYMEKINSGSLADHCFAEFGYALGQGKKIVPVITDSYFQNRANWDGKLGFRIPFSELYVDFSKADNIKYLVSTIKSKM